MLSRMPFSQIHIKIAIHERCEYTAWVRRTSKLGAKARHVSIQRVSTRLPKLCPTTTTTTNPSSPLHPNHEATNPPRKTPARPANPKSHTPTHRKNGPPPNPTHPRPAPLPIPTPHRAHSWQSRAAARRNRGNRRRRERRRGSEPRFAFGSWPRGRGHWQGRWQFERQGAGEHGLGHGCWYVIEVEGEEWGANSEADFNAANAVVEATHRHKAIFYDGE